MLNYNKDNAIEGALVATKFFVLTACITTSTPWENPYGIPGKKIPSTRRSSFENPREG